MQHDIERQLDQTEVRMLSQQYPRLPETNPAKRTRQCFVHHRISPLQTPIWVVCDPKFSQTQLSNQTSTQASTRSVLILPFCIAPLVFHLRSWALRKAAMQYSILSLPFLVVLGSCSLLLPHSVFVSVPLALPATRDLRSLCDPPKSMTTQPRGILHETAQPEAHRGSLPVQ